MAGLNDDPLRVFWFTIICCGINLTATAICLMAGALFRSMAVANLISSLLLLFSLLFCGFLLNKDSQLPFFKFFEGLSFLNYAYEALLVNEFSGGSFYFDAKSFDSVVIPVSGKVILDQLGMDAGRFTSDIGYLALILGCDLIATYLILRFIVKETR